MRNHLFFFIALAVSFSSLSGLAAPAGSIGMNKFDLAMQYTGRASGSDGSETFRNLTRRMAKKSLQDLADHGLNYVRVAVTGYGPVAYNQSGDLDLWLQDSPAYWAQIEEMFSDLKKLKIRLIPSFVWNTQQFPAMTGEKLRDFLSNPNSKSYQLLVRYISEFIPRAQKAGIVEFYELTNELNLGADLDIIQYCKENTPDDRCAPLSNYTTDEMIGFTRRLAASIRSFDKTKPLSSGFALARASAEHLRRRPGWSPQGADWSLDSFAEFSKNLAEIHQDLEIVSVHIYNGPENDRFGKTGADILDAVQAATQKINKKLFIGEFNELGAGDSFFQALVEKIAWLKIPWSAGWVWQFYQESVTKIDPVGNLEPGYSDRRIQMVEAANRKLGNPALSQVDQRPPQVLITSPLQGAKVQVKTPFVFYGVASDDRSGIARVEFYIQGKKVGESVQAPFKLDTYLGAPGPHVFEMKAWDKAGKVSTDRVVIEAFP